MGKSKERSRSRSRKRSRRDDSYESRRRRREKDSRRDRRHSSEEDDDYRRRDRNRHHKRRRDNSWNREQDEEVKRRARLAKARMLSLLQHNEMGLDEDEEHQKEAQNLVIDDDHLLKEQLRLFEESGLEGKKIIKPQEESKAEETDQIDKSKSEYSQDGSKINDSIRDQSQPQEDFIAQNQDGKSRIFVESFLDDFSKSSKTAPKKTTTKAEFVKVDVKSEIKKESSSNRNKMIPEINLSKIQVKSNNKVRDVFETDSDRSPKKTVEVTNSEHVSQFDVDEEDPLDAYMKTIKDEAAIQDDLGFNDDDEKSIENVISFEEIQKQHYESAAENSNIDSDDEMQIDNKSETGNLDDDKYYKEFIQKFRQQQAHDNQERFFNDDDNYLDELNNKPTGEDFLERQKKASEKREMLLSSKLQQCTEFEQFEKNFYIEPKEISIMNEEEVEKYRKELGDVAVRGLQCPRPIKSWYHCGLNQRILAVLKKKGFEGPRPIQCQAIPAIMGGRDVIGIAETGSGKTLAYLLPMLRHILNQRPLKEGEGMIGLIMAPTRELAQQIYFEAKFFTKVLNLNIVCVYGGAEVGSQLSQLKRPVEIVVCTPGRMIDVLTTNGGKFTNLHRVTYLVLDEADRMLDMGFEPQISRIIGGTRDDRQTVMFSATFPKTIVSLAKRILKSPLEIVVGNRGAACRSIEQFVKIVDEEDKLLLLTNLIDEWIGEGSILIFVDTQKEADELFKQLFDLKYDLFVLHGGVDHTDREYTIQDFKKGIRKIMVATSIAARGLDIKFIRVVINYKCPDHMEDYIHRIGRTGRAGSQGTAYTFITHDESHLAGDLIKSLKSSEQPVDQELIEMDEEYTRKVKEGEIDRVKKYSVTTGRGFDFTEEERKNYTDQKKNLEKGFYAEDAEDVSDSEINIREANDRQDEGVQLSDFRVNEILRDPKARQIAKEASLKATKEALIQGVSKDKLAEIVDKAIIDALKEYKPQSKFEKGMAQAMEIRDSYAMRENEQSNHFSVELQINDYPQQSRTKVCSKDFLSSIYELTGCQISVRGSYFEPGKAPPLGQKKQYLFIEGDSKLEVSNAFKEVKRVIEESASNFAVSSMNANPGRYSVV
jgi:ATP-dependent RNA helicase DDX46/PRP5